MSQYDQVDNNKEMEFDQYEQYKNNRDKYTIYNSRPFMAGTLSSQ